MVFFGSYMGWLSIRKNDKFGWLQSTTNFLAAIDGTNFRQSDLTDVSFEKAVLKNVDLRQAKITRTYWFQVQGLEYTRFGNSYLKYPKVQKLVRTLQGKDQSFDGLNLAGVNLKGAELQNTSFIEANLNNFNLRYADLSGANLRQVQLDGADLTGAILTGACIEGWGKLQAQPNWTMCCVTISIP